MTALLILGEDVAHGALAGELVRRTLLEHAEAVGAHWFVDHVDATLGWQGEESLAEVRAGLRYTKSSAAAKKLRLRGARPETRHAFPASSAPEAQYWRDVLTWARLSQDLEGIVVATDTDGIDRAVLAAVAQHLPDLDRPSAPRPIVLAIAHPEAESWFVLGFVPTHEAERQRHGELVRALGFDPVTAPHRLTARPNDAATDAKRVLCGLLWGHHRAKAAGREQLPELLSRCLPAAAIIEAHGAACGIRAFVADVRHWLSPRFGLPPG